MGTPQRQAQIVSRLKLLDTRMITTTVHVGNPAARTSLHLSWFSSPAASPARNPAFGIWSNEKRPHYNRRAASVHHLIKLQNQITEFGGGGDNIIDGVKSGKGFK